MEEKVLIKSERNSAAKTVIPIILLGAVYSGYMYIKNRNYSDSIVSVLNLIPFLFSLIGSWLFILSQRSELTVTNKRIYGTLAWGKRVDLPIDSISAVAMVNNSKKVSFSTSSGRISFPGIKNADAIYTVVNNLLVKRQQEKVIAPVTNITHQSDEADLLKKFKDLLDSGVIAQEEFDAKKKQILGL